MSIDVSSIYGSPKASATTAATTATTASSSTGLDKEAFLKLLVAQLRNQDPSKPMDSSDLMNQTTQLSTMEQLTALTKTSQESFALQMRMAAASLVGQQVTYTTTAGASATGTVTAVSYSGSVPTVKVGGDDVVALDAVSAVTAASTSSTTSNATASTTLA
jgi:flagellar basal-body rod modification protein FlgD